MSFTLEKVVPWGRTYTEYCEIFLLTQDDIKKRIIGVGDGPASFNFEASLKNLSITSVDPLYQFSKTEIKQRVDQTYQTVLQLVEKNRNQFVWEKIKNPAALGKIRLDAMNKFMGDFEVGKSEGRYINAKLPKLPFDSNSFDIALVSHFLFLYSEHHDTKFHIDSIVELLRISNEVRIFPLLELNNEKSRHLDNVITHFENNFNISILKTEYEFQKGGNEMLIVKKI